MPVNPKTGKTDRHALPEDELYAFRVKQAEERRTEVGRGKQRASGSADAEESESSVPAPSPLGLSSLKVLTLDSGGSSAANTPVDSPNDGPQPPLPEDEEPAPPPAQKAPKRSKGKTSFKCFAGSLIQLLTGFVVEVPAVSRLLKPTRRQDSSSRSAPSAASDDGSNAARIASLESRVTSLEAKQASLEKEVRELRLTVESLDS
jgi:hypothetical protein